MFLDQPEQAVEYFRRSIAVDPSSEAAQFALGDALMRMGKPEESLTPLKAAVRLNPNMRQAYALLSRAYQKLKRPSEAAEAKRKFLELSDRELQREQNQRPEKP